MKHKRLLQLCQIGVVAALVFATSGLRIIIPIAGGNTALHLGNVLCLLGGLLLGPIPGGLAAGIGSALYDLTNPLYVAGAIFTLVFKFFIGFLAGKIAHSGGRNGLNPRWNMVGGVVGSITYTVLYVAKSFVSALLVGGLAVGPALVTVIPKLTASAINGMIAVAVAVPLSLVLSQALRKSGYKIA